MIKSDSRHPKLLAVHRNKLEKWFPLQGERAHSLNLFCIYNKRFEISKTK